MLSNNKHQHNALQIISVQHELAMAIGTEISLRDMLQSFLTVCIKRLGLISAHCYIYTDAQGWPATRPNEFGFQGAPEHFISIPTLKDGKPWKDSKRLASLVTADHSGNYYHQQHEGNHFYSFPIPEHGFAIIQARVEVESNFLNALKPIFSRLGNSCHASILHESLLREMLAREEVERTLQHQAFHSNTTDLPNRHMLLQIMDQENFWSSDEAEKKALLCVEIENYRKITGILGHAFGDAVQKHFADLLKRVTSNSDTVSQLDADVFMLIIDPNEQPDQPLQNIVEAVVNQLKSIISEPAMIGANAVMLSIKTGYEVFPSVDSDSSQIIKHAEIAKSESVLHEADNTTLYCCSMQEKANNRIRMEQSLKLAASKDELALWWQPQYDAKHMLIGAEALLRWNSEEWGFVSPGVFIPIAEESALIEEIGDWVLEKACRQLADLCALGIPEGFKKLSINVNARQLIQEDFVENVIRFTEQYNIPAGLLAIELTESTLVQSFERAFKLIDRLGAAGIQCSIDDFGTGYSSLNYLRKLPIQTIKIDQSFVRDLHLCESDQAIAKTLIYLGKVLHKDVIAEGVETEDELNCLLSMGCKQFQGFYYDRPMPLQSLKERWYPDENKLLASA